MAIPPSFQIGPLALATDRAVAVLVIIVFLIIAGLVATRVDRTADRGSWWALAAGIVAARAGYVVGNWDTFAAEPAAILAVWQGGLSLAAGLAGALAAIALTMRMKQPAIMLATTIVLLAGLYVGVSTLLRPDPRPLPTHIALERWSGGTQALSELRGQPFVVNLWASWCLPCRREMPMLVDEASRSPVPILLVNSGEQRSAAEEFLRSNRLPSQSVYLDSTASLTAAIGAGGYPATLFVNAAGQIETVHLGEISRAMLATELRALEQQIRQAGG